MRIFRLYFLFLGLVTNSLFSSVKEEYLVGHLQGQLGNQLFIIAATVSLALDNDAIPVFPGLLENSSYNIPLNYQIFFSNLNAKLPNHVKIKKRFTEQQFNFSPIPYKKNMELFGYFQSEKYFAHHKNEIRELFAPTQDIKVYLATKYSEILNHPNTVSIHTRSYYKEDPAGACHNTLGREYLEKAIQLFPEDSLFIVFSNDIAWCKTLLVQIPRNIVFIENETHFHDFYLMSMCKHNIICNSSFSWWAAYLNSNPSKIVVAPDLWFNKSYIHSTEDLKPAEWIVIK